MTFSIVARDPATGMFGVAVTTKFFGVGSLCPFARAGVCAARAGSECIDWFGHQTFDGFSVAGNMLAGPLVVPETGRAFQASADLPFAERLILALEAGQAAGGDKRGRQSAALYIVGTEVYPYLDLRVDDHPDPLVELRRLYVECQVE